MAPRRKIPIPVKSVIYLFSFYISFAILSSVQGSSPQTPITAGEPSQESHPQEASQLETEEVALYGRINHTYNSSCFVGNDKHSYELIKSKELASDPFKNTLGKTITIRGKRVQKKSKHCSATVEVSSWSFFPEGDQPEHWDTYQNSYYGYEVKYPPWWSYRPKRSLDISQIYFGGSPIGIGVSRKQNSTEEWLPYDLGEIVDEQSVTVGGFKARWVKTHFEGSMRIPWETVLFKTETYRVFIWSGDADNFDHSLTPHEVFMTMLSTFRWLETSGGEIPKGWLPYHNETFKYSLYHPPDWIAKEQTGQTDVLFYERTNQVSPIMRINVSGPRGRSGYDYPDLFEPFAQVRDWKEIVVDGMISFSFPKKGRIYVPHRDMAHLLQVRFYAESQERMELVEKVTGTLRFDQRAQDGM